MWDSVDKGVGSEELKKNESSKVVMGRPSQCIYRVIQGFLTHGILLCIVFVHGF